jgi:hypothetical protein
MCDHVIAASGEAYQQKYQLIELTSLRETGLLDPMLYNQESLGGSFMESQLFCR